MVWVWVLYVKREVDMVLLMQLECEWIVLDGMGMGVVCEVWLRHGVIDAARMQMDCTGWYGCCSM